MTENQKIVSLNEWKGVKLNELESFLPKNWNNLEDFLGYCEIHSETQRALFHIEQITALYKMAGYPIDDLPDEISGKTMGNFYPLHSDYMKPFIEIIRNRKSSIEIKPETAG